MYKGNNVLDGRPCSGSLELLELGTEDCSFNGVFSPICVFNDGEGESGGTQSKAHGGRADNVQYNLGIPSFS